MHSSFRQVKAIPKTKIALILMQHKNRFHVNFKPKDETAEPSKFEWARPI